MHILGAGASAHAGHPIVPTVGDRLPPISAKKLLDRTLSLYRRNSLNFVGLTIIGPVAACAFRLCFGGGTAAFMRPHASEVVPAVLAAGVGIVIVMTCAAVSSAATVQAVATASCGKKVHVAGGYRSLARRLWKTIGIVLSVLMRACCASLLCFGVGAIGLAVAAALGFNSRVEAGIIGYACGGFSLLSAAFATLWICARYAVAVQACVVESVGCRLALKRSAFLTAGDRGRIVTVHCVLLFLVLAADFVFGLPTLLLPGQGGAFRIAAAAAAFFALALISPLMTICMSLIYYDELLRKEVSAASSFAGIRDALVHGGPVP